MPSDAPPAVEMRSMESMQGRCYVKGSWLSTASSFPVHDPATGAEVGSAADAGPVEASSAVEAAAAAFPDWAALVPAERAAGIRRVSAALLAGVDDVSDVIVAEQGKPRAQAVWEVRYATEWLDWYAEEGRRAYGRVIPPGVPGKRLTALRQPVGPAVAITPWNFPVAMIARKLAPALAAGCTMIVKPAEQTPLSAVKLFEAIDAAGLPPGVANLITSASPEAVAPALLEDARVRKITFTGSTEVGKLLVRASATNLARLSLELGGHAPFVVFDDADLDAAVAGMLAAKFQVNAQSCLCPNRTYVQRGVLEDFTGRLTAAVGAMRVGRGDGADTELGPLIDEPTYRKVQRHVDDALDQGAQVAVGGSRLGGEDHEAGFFFAPTVLTGCTDAMLIAREETFGPVVPIFPFDDEAEVIARANDSRYGLAAYVYTRDLGRATRVSEALEYGIVGINDPRPASPAAPFGGFKESGLGREGSSDGLDEFLETKLVSVVV
jgi:succinate-semialdehyde dehydrogenase/glutarate-semialdehyde dehydrogenase